MRRASELLHLPSVKRWGDGLWAMGEGEWDGDGDDDGSRGDRSIEVEASDEMVTGPEMGGNCALDEVWFEKRHNLVQA